MTSSSSRRIDAFDQWCLCHILRIPYTSHVTNDEVRRRTCQPPATHFITTRRLRLFGHIARAGPSQDHSRALRAAISRLPVDWQRPPGRPRRTWLRTIELDLQQHNLGLNPRRGSVRRTVPSGVNSWRRLCPAKDAPPDDDDDECSLLLLLGILLSKRTEQHRCRENVTQ